MLFFNQLSWLVCCDGCRFAVAAAIDLTNMLDDPDLHRYDFKLLADFLTNGVFAAAADASQFMLGKFVDDLDARKVSRQRLALATTFDGGDNLFFSVFVGSFDDAFGFVEERQLRCGRIGCLLGLASEQTLAQQCVLFF